MRVKKPWAAFGLFKTSMGKIMRDNGGSLEILCIEGQYYPWELWDSKYVKRFDTPEELAYYISDFWHLCDYDTAMYRLRENFPSSFRNRKKSPTAKCSKHGHDFSYNGKKTPSQIKCKRCKMGILEWVKNREEEYKRKGLIV